MKLNHALFISLILFQLFSCKKKRGEEMAPQKEAEKTVYQYIVKIDTLRTVTTGIIKLAGDLDTSYKVLANQAKYDVTLYKLYYQTTYKGQETTASGVLAVPKGSSPGWPTLSFHRGTIFDQADAPSNNYFQQLSIAAMASSGYLVSAPDYLGFGASETITHPYYVAHYSTSAAKDMLLAAQELFGKHGVPFSGRLFLAGYSQGGNVTLAVAKNLEGEPLPKFNLVASAAGAGGYNLIGIFHTIMARDSFPSPNYLAYTIQSFRVTYDWSTPLNYYFKAPYASRIPSLINGKTPGATVNSNLTTHLKSLFQENFVTAVQNGSDTAFVNALQGNSLNDWKPTKPLRFYHGTADEVVPYSDTDSTYKHMQSLGATNVSLVSLEGRNHSTGAVPMLGDVIVWFASIP